MTATVKTYRVTVSEQDGRRVSSRLYTSLPEARRAHELALTNGMGATLEAQAYPIPAVPPRHMVERIVDRVHLGESNRQLLAYVRGRLARVVRYGRPAKTFRKAVYRVALEHRAHNQAIYSAVARGDLRQLP